MPTRITVRYLGSEVGKKVARPDTKGELLELAAKRLNLSTPALRVFATDARLGRLREAASPAPSQHRAARPPLRAACIAPYASGLPTDGERRRHRGRAYDDAFFSVSLSQPNSLSLQGVLSLNTRRWTADRVCDFSVCM